MYSIAFHYWSYKGIHLYLANKAFSDGHRVGITLLEITKKVPENTKLKEISVRFALIIHTFSYFFPPDI